MTSPTGNRAGFTLIEVLVAVIIVALGTTAVFRIFMQSLQTLHYLTNRIYASTALENRLAQIEEALRTRNTLVLNPGGEGSSAYGFEQPVFKPEMTIEHLRGDGGHLFRVNVSVGWNEGQRPVELSRVAYIAKRGATRE